MKKLALLLVSAVVLGGCTLGATTPAPTSTPEPTAMPSASPTTSAKLPPEAMVMVDSKGMVDVKGLNFSFDIKEIRVKKGQKLTVNFTNTEGFHDFVIDELEVNSGMVAQGKTQAVVIPTDKVGTFEYYCSVGQHRANGMWGKLIVEE